MFEKFKCYVDLNIFLGKSEIVFVVLILNKFILFDRMKFGFMVGFLRMLRLCVFFVVEIWKREKKF